MTSITNTWLMSTSMSCRQTMARNGFYGTWRWSPWLRASCMPCARWPGLRNCFANEKRVGTRGAANFSGCGMNITAAFGIDVKNSGRIAFVEGMAEARNRIVHAGGEANTWKPLDQLDWSSGDDGLLEVDFSKQYPEYVWGTGPNAEVRVSEVLLDKNIKASIELVAWLAGELRRKELASVKMGEK